MKLVWHIVGKDARRMAVPVLAWLGLILAGAIWFWAMPRPERWDPAGLLNAATNWSTMIVAMQLIVGFILAAATALEDPVDGTTQFWTTRPISKGRMFAAKIASTGLLFVVAPAAVLTPIWLLSGFSIRELVSAAGEFMLGQAAITVAALTIAAITPNLARFLGGTVLLLVLFGGCLVGALMASVEDGGTWTTRIFVIQTFCILPMFPAVLMHQYLTRHTVRSWGMVGTGFALVLLVVLSAWPWDITPGLVRMFDPGLAARPEDRAVEISLRPQLGVRINHVLPADGVYVPLAATGALARRDGTGDYKINLRLGQSWPAPLVRAVALGETPPGATEWSLVATDESGEDERFGPDAPVFAGRLIVGLFQARVLGQLAVRENAKLAAGTNRVRIIAIEEEEQTGRPLAILVEERDNWSRFRDGPFTLGWHALGHSRRRFDGYVLRGSSSAEVLATDEPGSVVMNSMLIGYRRLRLPEKTTARDLDGAVLVKVRFTETRRFRRVVEKQAVVAAREERAQ